MQNQETQDREKAGFKKEISMSLEQFGDLLIWIGRVGFVLLGALLALVIFLWFVGDIQIIVR